MSNKKEKRWTINQIRDSLKRGQELRIPSKTWCYIEDLQSHMLRAFRKVSPKQYIEINIDAILEKVTDYLKDFVDVKAFLKDLLIGGSTPKQLLDLEERIEKKAAVKQKDGCYYITVYGYKRPVRIMCTVFLGLC